MDRRIFLSLSLASFAPIAGSAGVVTPAEKLRATGEAYFTDWLNGFYAKALAAGISPSVLDRELVGLSPEPKIGVLDARQPEIARPISDYIKGSMSEARIAAGRARRATIGQFPAIEQTYGVPREILIAVWAMESAFGAVQGNFDVVRALATLAANDRRRAWAEGELLAALKILAFGEVPRARLKGSWAGAMGQTQLLPSTYLASAVDLEGGGAPDIWGSPADALASAANLLAKAGWRHGEGWAREVILPAGFDFGLSEGPKEVPSWWQDRGVRRADGLSWSGPEAGARCLLLLPTGASGPAFLALPNHFAIRAYNNSVAYALTVGLLADRFAGGGSLRTPWPVETPLALSERIEAQTALNQLGFNPGPIDGIIGLGARQALREWQKSEHLPADGYLSPDMVRRLRGSTHL